MIGGYWSPALNEVFCFLPSKPRHLVLTSCTVLEYQASQTQNHGTPLVSPGDLDPICYWDLLVGLLVVVSGTWGELEGQIIKQKAVDATGKGQASEQRREGGS